VSLADGVLAALGPKHKNPDSLQNLEQVGMNA